MLVRMRGICPRHSGRDIADLVRCSVGQFFIDHTSRIHVLLLIIQLSTRLVLRGISCVRNEKVGVRS